MQFLEWKDEYNIGIKEIDIQHRGIFDMISKLFKTRQYEPEGKFFFLTLDKLQEYAKIHFLTEERYMREAEYPRLIEHQQLHEEFLTEIEKLMRDLEKKDQETENMILDYLKNWYMSHILGIDRDYEKVLLSKGFK